MGTYGECEKMVRAPRIVLEEKRTKITFRNPGRQRVRRIVIDGCVTTRGPRCDYLLITKNSTAYYVELKGANVGHAVKQLESTLRSLREGDIRVCLAVSRRSPLASPEIQKLKIRFKRDHNAQFSIVRSHSEYSLAK